MTLQLSEGVLNRRVFNQSIYDQHRKVFMLGQTPPYVNPKKAVLDIGAAVGMYTHFWAPICRVVHAYEAVPPVYDQLVITAQRHPNVVTHNEAVSDYNGDAEFWVDDKRLSNSSFNDLVGGQKITVPVTKLDSHYYGEVGFMKIDVEGFELDVLRGAHNLIRIDHPNIMCEIYPKFNNGPVIDTFNFLFNRDYKCFYNLRGKGLQPVKDAKEGAAIAGDEALIKQHDGDFLFVYGD